ncbi:hypothetical protein B0H14DRAFT_3133701 [Mycena olivaceomarginata]|nr:hypothetical protein B0H14DRAFT_3133701 [Mycena olivaceomarginata]
MPGERDLVNTILSFVGGELSTASAKATKLVSATSSTSSASHSAIMLPTVLPSLSSGYMSASSTESVQHRNPPVPASVIVGVSIAIAAAILLIGLAAFILRARCRRNNMKRALGTVSSPFVRFGPSTPGWGGSGLGDVSHDRQQSFEQAAQTKAGACLNSNLTPTRHHAGGHQHHPSETDSAISALCMQMARLEAELRESMALMAPPTYA